MILRSIPRFFLLWALLLLGSGVAWAAPAKPPIVKSSVAEPPVTADSLLVQAHDAIAKGDTELALRLAQSAIVADPARPASYVALGDIYAGTGQADYARNYYDAALGIDPAEPSALKALSELDRTHPGDTARANQ